MKPTTSTLVGALKHPAVWISVAFLGLVVMGAYFWVADRTTIPVGITGSVLYPVLLAALAYVLVFHRRIITATSRRSSQHAASGWAWSRCSS
ncbi:hypothetical protein [Tessaracoccus massiliensis]|uniref:hypothetical protein n=1 Tax=Tessaracoccus massiliensis TaxID=1522311 RepID=UPI00058D5BB1|nr:hypothetical protein [Tessaracoccus massiliensis]